MNRTVAFICMLAVGGLLALQSPANAALSTRVSNLGAAFVSLVISVAIIGALLLAFGHPSRLSGLVGFRLEDTVGGIGGAAVVAVGLVAVRPLGVSVAIALLVVGQLAVSLVSDQLGWFGVHEVGLNPSRFLGLALVIGGTVLIARA